MKKILLLVFAIANTVVYAQSKKKQIITLNSRVDSFRLALSNEIKLSNENSLKLNNRVDSFRLALLSERQSKLSNEKRDALKINNFKIEIENSEAALEAERNLNNILNNELKKKELIIDSLRAESNKNHIFKGEEAYAVVNKLTSAHSKFYKNYKGNETYETREQERERLESLLYSYHTCLGYFYNYDESHFTHYKNIKNDKVYSTFKSFKYLVDTIYKLGFKICMDEGIYYVDEDSKDCTTECDGCD